MRQLWGFVGTCGFVTVILHLTFLTLGLLGTFPSIITNYIWPVLKNILIGLLVVESLTIVFRIVAKSFLVCRTAPLADFYSSCFCSDSGWPCYSSAAVCNLRRKCCSHLLMCCPPYFFVQYAYSILSIVSGIVALFITIGVTAFTGFLTLARLDIRKISVPLVSRIMEPASSAFCAALMVDHDNTNPIKFMAIEWLCERLQALRKAEVR